MTKKKKRLIFDIIGYVVIGISLLFSVFGLIIRINSGTLYIFDHRMDVVLTNSMSAKSEKYKDFLEGHDNQIQPLDLVVSQKLKYYDNLEVYDIVLFNNPGIGTTVHRVVGKEYFRSDKVALNKITFATFNGVKTFQLNDVLSGLRFAHNSYQSVDIVLYSKEDYQNHYNFVGQDKNLDYTVKTEKVDSYYVHNIHISKETTSPTYFNLAHHDYFDYSIDYFKEINVHSSFGDIIVSAETINKDVIPDEYIYETNISYKYEIRGDLSETSDGKFTMDDIYAKVVNVVPKIGMFFRFIGSVYGIILLVGLIAITIVVEFMLDRNDKKEKLKAINNGEISENIDASPEKSENTIENKDNSTNEKD